ncbi:hypothetical protein Prum_075150 [Phytohabitans rumicis]|uniref:Uncharacterized protein n=1 Tax=Phytohabitans rumicis TaxID=1076125 RepID=A0A6V8L9G6_9ACTN|nr:hypothetical protein Prum_075150 [Phytohabitans rumicis]
MRVTVLSETSVPATSMEPSDQRLPFSTWVSPGWPRTLDGDGDAEDGDGACVGLCGRLAGGRLVGGAAEPGAAEPVVPGRVAGGGAAGVVSGPVWAASAQLAIPPRPSTVATARAAPARRAVCPGGHEATRGWPRSG